MQCSLTAKIPQGAAFYTRALLLSILLLATANAGAQSVRVLSTNDGLPQSFISGLAQDDTGFVWIGTRNGLARYDGIQYKVFQHDRRDSNSLASNLIIWIRPDHKNHLWIEHETGEVDGLDPVTEKITHLLKINRSPDDQVRHIWRGWLVDNDSIFWGIIRGNGLNTYDSRTRRIEHYTRANAGFQSDTIRGLVETKQKEIWVLNNGGISHFDRHTRQFTHWTLPFAQNYGEFSGSDAVAIDLHERANGELMWGDRHGLFFFNPQNQKFRTVVLPALSYLGIRWIRTGMDGMDYCESYGKVFRYSDSTGLTSIGETIKQNFGDVKSFLVDRSGLIWFGTDAAGITQIDLEAPFFQSYPYKKDFVTDVLQQHFGVDMKKTFDWTVKDNVFSPPSYHLRSVYDAHGRLYVALKESVCRYDSGQKSFTTLPRVPFIRGNDERSAIAIKGIAVLPDGSPLVIGFNGNLFVYRSSGKTWDPFVDPSLIRNTFGSAILPQDILVDDQTIWITTANHGLLDIDLATKHLHRLKADQIPGSLPADQLLSLRADPKRPDMLWIGSFEGLIGLNKKSRRCEVFSLREGLPDNIIYSILADRLGDLWLSTNKGLCRFDPVTHEVRAFRTQNGLQGDEFNRFHQLELPDGRLIFGGTNGWTIFDPRLMKHDDFDPVLAFTDLRINNKDARQLPANPAFRLPTNALDQLILTYAQNTISIGFAGLQYSHPQDLLYRYRLEGYDNDWVQAGNTHQASYTKIPPGDYTLYVNASNSTGKWSAHIKSLRLKIGSPWWATRMAYVCYCIILAGLTWTFLRFRINRIIMRQEILLKQKEAQQLMELDDMKSRFFSNITHEFRTPLTLILGPAEQLKAGMSNDGRMSRLADTIVNNAKQLLILINRLMDLSKIEAKALKLHEQKGNPGDAVGALVYSFETDAAARQVLLSFNDATGAIECWYYADALERIVYNLISNALKFTPAGGKVTVSLSAKAGMLHLIVQDNGAGIAANKLPHIFDRFYQAAEGTGLSSEHRSAGTGIGLALVKELIDQMKGTIEVESQVAGSADPGTIFTLTLPYRPTEESAGPPDEQFAHPEAFDDDEDKTPQVLLVEDNAELAAFILSILSPQYQVEHVLNGAMGVEQALAKMPDLILSDVMMPVMDGYELCSRIKADIRTSHIPVILLTAKAAKENLLEGLSKGADDYLTKPFFPTELLLRVRNLLARQQKLRERIRQELMETVALPGIATIPVTPTTELPKESAIQDIFLTRLYETLDEHLDDPLFGVDQIVDTMHLSRSSLHRKLKALTGFSTSEVVRNYRLKKATHLLREGHTSSDTAYKSGFGSPAYFAKCFREVYGMTPGDYIRQFKN
jgi:signal transduction histidine kinase/DNA-binding response OmpR family regulator/ligand-binding sensor domain-containing protein